MSELLTFAIGLAWLVVMLAIPVGLWVFLASAQPEWDEPIVPIFATVWLLIGLAWVCLRLGGTIRPWLVEVLKAGA